MSMEDPEMPGARVVLLTALLGLAAAACTNASDSAEPVSTLGVIGDKEAAEEFWVEARTLTLPPGVTWPAQPPLPAPGPGLFGNPPGNGYEVGFGTGMADAVFFCAWMNEWLAQRTLDAQ